MEGMFEGSAFSGDISNWDVSNITNSVNTFHNCPIKEKYKPKFNN